MKDVREIRLLGIGFVIGIVFCYFVALAEHSIGADLLIPSFTNRTGNWHTTNMVVYRALSNELRLNPGITKPHAPMLAPEIQDQKPGKVVEIDLNLLNWNQGAIPNLNERRMRIEPALKINHQFPGGVPQYDLIDLNYKPDFTLPD